MKTQDFCISRLVMNYPRLFALSALFSVNLLAACQPYGSDSRMTSVYPQVTNGIGTEVPTPDSTNSQGTTKSPTVLNGTSDRGGGGNLINGKPLDFYMVDIRTLPEYKTYIAPKLAKLDQTISGSGNNMQLLQNVVQNLNWYIVPVPLDEIPARDINAGFASIQGARQFEGEVFIDENIRNDMLEEERGQLLFHEIVMAFYRMKFKPMAEYCLSMTASKHKENCLRFTSDNNNNVAFMPVVQKEFLLPQDYVSIRRMTKTMYDQAMTISKEALNMELGATGFDSRIFNPAAEYKRKSSQESESLNREQVIALLDQLQPADTAAVHCGFEDVPGKGMQSTSQCKATYRLEKDHLILRYEVTAGKDKGRKKEMKFDLQDSRRDFMINEVHLRNGTVAYYVQLYSPNENKKVGEVYFTLNLLFDKYEDDGYVTFRGLDLTMVRRSIAIDPKTKESRLVGSVAPVIPELKVFDLILTVPELDAYTHEFSIL